MPFAITDEQKNQQQGAQAPNISGNALAINVPGQGAGAGKMSQAAQGPKESGQFQNIQKYLAANQEQGTAMGQKVAANVESQIGKATQAGQALQGSVKAPQVYDPNKVLSNLPGATEAEKSQYQTTKQTGGYTGPSDISGLEQYNPYQKESEAAKTQLAQSQTETGQQELLRQAYNRPTYSRGQSALDQALLSQSEGGKSAINSLGSKYSDLANFLGGYGTQAQANIAEAQKQAAANVAAFQPAEQQAQQAIMSPIEQRAAAANLEAQKYDQYLQDVSDLKLKQETMAALGLAPGQHTYGINLSNYLNPQLSPATVQNIATEQERQKYNDLMNFIGGNSGQLGLGKPTYTGLSVDKERLANDLAQKQKDFEELARNTNFNSFGRANIGVVNDIDWSGLPAEQTASANLSKYLSDPNSISLNLAGNTGLYRYLDLRPYYEQAGKTAKNNLINQINQFLSQQNYNDIISQEGV